MSESRVAVYTASAFVAYAIATSTNFVRVFTRGYLLRQFGIDDYLVLTGSVAQTISMPFYYYAMKHASRIVSEHGPGGNVITGAVQTVFQEDPTLNKHLFIIAKLYLVSFGFVKLGILSFLLRFLQRGHLRRATYVVAAVVGAFTVAGLLMSTFRCRPLSKAWTSTSPEGHCAISPIVPHVSFSSFHLLTDIVILLLPIPMVMKLHASPRRKAGLILIFSIGLVGTAETGRRLAAAVQALRHPQRDELRVIEIPFRSNIEITAVTVGANLPAFASLWNYIRRRRQESKASSAAGPSTRMSPLALRPGYDENKTAISSSVTAMTGSDDLEKCSTNERTYVSASPGDILRSTKLEVSVESPPSRPRPCL